ncbi:MAG: DoxX family protein [Candidatus Omnitrophota bacterium]
MNNWECLPLRLSLGIIFIAHGLQKAFGFFGGKGVGAFAGMLAQLGFRPPVFWAYLATYTELLCGILLILGLFTRTASALLFILMVVAVVAVHFSNGFFAANGGFEYQFLIMAGLISLAMMGTGKFGLTRKF